MQSSSSTLGQRYFVCFANNYTFPRVATGTVPNWLGYTTASSGGAEKETLFFVAPVEINQSVHWALKLDSD